MQDLILHFASCFQNFELKNFKTILNCQSCLKRKILKIISLLLTKNALILEVIRNRLNGQIINYIINHFYCDL